MPDELATGSDIIGSTATRGKCCSDSCSATAADKTGPCAAWDSEALTSNSPATSSISRAPEFELEFKLEFVLDTRAAPPPVTAPAAAAEALVPAAGGAVRERTGASGLAVPEAAETNLLAAAARSTEFTATLGACVVFLESVAAFLPFSLHFSRSTTSSRAL